MDVIDVLQQPFITAAQDDTMARIASAELDTDAENCTQRRLSVSPR